MLICLVLYSTERFWNLAILLVFSSFRSYLFCKESVYSSQYWNTVHVQGRTSARRFGETLRWNDDDDDCVRLVTIHCGTKVLVFKWSERFAFAKKREKKNTSIQKEKLKEKAACTWGGVCPTHWEESLPWPLPLQSNIPVGAFPSVRRVYVIL